jgi:hypothetical protein
MLRYGKEKELYSNRTTNMKVLRTLLGCLSTTFSIWLLCGCSTSHPSSSNEDQLNTETLLINTNKVFLKDQSGVERVFTNANVVMWVPTRAKYVWDGPTSGIQIDEITPPGVFVRDYKIYVEIQVNDTAEFKEFFVPKEDLAVPTNRAHVDWCFQEHPELSVTNAQYGKQLRKDIRDTSRGRVLMVNGVVKSSRTLEADLETAKKMIESIKLIPK